MLFFNVTDAFLITEAYSVCVIPHWHQAFGKLDFTVLLLSALN